MRNHALLALLLALAVAPALRAQDVGLKPPIPDDKDPVTTPSGLKYSILKAGAEGPAPKLGDTVKVHYTGWLTDGTVFDSSRTRGQPASFKLGQVVEGWNEGLTHLTTGGTIKLTIPPELGYGPSGQGKIPPNATLVFEVELLELTPGPAIPTFRKAVPEAQKTTESGLKYEVITAGSGDEPTATENCKLRYALWTEAGKLVDCTEMSGRPLTGPPSKMPLPFLREAVVLLKPGARYRFEVPPALCFGSQARGPVPPNAVTVWEVELEAVLRPLPVPEFSVSPEEKVKTTASGLKYEVIKEGDGKSPKMGENVTVHYAGWLSDGKPFDSSFERGEPATFQLGQVIPGWNEGLQLMKEGAVYKFTIPAALAYGEAGRPPVIPPNATLIFHVELKSVGP